MSTETQNNALESAEPLVARDLLRRAKMVLQLVDKDKGSTICTGGLISDISTYLAAPVAAQAQPDPRTPADMLVNGGALKLALNTLRRARKNEIADELEKSATPAQQPVSGAEGLPPLPRGISKHSVIGHDADVYTDVHMLDYARAALAQQDATLHAEVLDMVRMLEANEWADHCGKSELGQRLEWAITALQNRPQNIPEIIPESAQLDADKVQADLLNSLIEIVAAVIASDEEGLIEHSETIIKARAAIDAARKEAAHG